MNKIYFIYNYSELNSAATNRILAIAKGCAELNVKAVIIFTSLPSSCYKQLNIVTNLQYVFLNKNGHFGYLKTLFTLYKYLIKLEEGANIFIYGLSNYNYIVRFFHKKFNIYEEHTEHPYVNMDLLSLFSKYLVKRLLRTTYRLKGLFVISTPLKQFYIDSVGINKKKVHVINMIVDSTRFEHLQNNPKENDDFIAYCGTLGNRKDGVDNLIKSFSIIHQQFPILKLYLIGKYPNKKIELKNTRLIEEYGLQDYVIHTGVVNADRMPQLLKNAKILLLSRPDNIQAQYGFPTKLGEYLLTKNPVVVTQVGDIPRFLKDKESAILAKANDIEDFANSVCWLLMNPEKAISIGENGYKVAMSNFNYLIESKKICDIIFGCDTKIETLSTK